MLLTKVLRDASCLLSLLCSLFLLVVSGIRAFPVVVVVFVNCHQRHVVIRMLRACRARRTPDHHFRWGLQQRRRWFKKMNATTGSMAYEQMLAVALDKQRAKVCGAERKLMCLTCCCCLLWGSDAGADLEGGVQVAHNLTGSTQVAQLRPGHTQGRQEIY